MKDVSNSARGAGNAGRSSAETPKRSTRRKLLIQAGATLAASMLARDASASGQSGSSAGDGAVTNNSTVTRSEQLACA